jgi:hypothetical protein
MLGSLVLNKVTRTQTAASGIAASFAVVLLDIARGSLEER